MNAVSIFVSTYRYMYQDESTKVSNVSVSRFAGPPHFGQLVSTNSGSCASGDPPRPVNCASRGSTTGSWSSGTGTVPSVGQYTMGMGVPQYRCREMSQSRSRYVTLGLPIPVFFASEAIAFLPISLDVPLYGPLRTIVPGPEYAASIARCSSPSGLTTSLIGSPYCFANAKSRSSCAGTAMIAPVPYVAST